MILWAEITFSENFRKKFVEIAISCIFAPLKTRNRERGFLAQLVQSIWFTPRGSGVESLRTQKKGTKPFQKFGFLALVPEHPVYTQGLPLPRKLGPSGI